VALHRVAPGFDSTADASERGRPDHPKEAVDAVVPDLPRSALRDAVLTWGGTAGRDLPWRHTRDPWTVLVSELMLQQTQVARVAPRWVAFRERFPTPGACATAPLGDVVRAWHGLGYNRRAVTLHRAAQQIVARHGGSLPADLDALVALPGVGPYTARAVLAFAFEADVGLVETNSARVLARAVSGRPLSRTEAQAAADELVPAGLAWAWNSAVTDLGATVCTKRTPDCAGCPIVDWCAWGRSGRPGRDPAEGTAGVGRRQSPFVGSDREGRGRMLDALRQGPVPLAELDRAAGWPGEQARARRVASGLVADGLAERLAEALVLP
jgi:A/G-specific adenine glycosylase